MENRKYVYAFKNVHGMITVINFDATNNEVNSFLGKFDGWGGHGEYKISTDRNHQEVWFECPKEFFDMLQTELFKKAFERMGVELVFDYPYDV